MGNGNDIIKAFTKRSVRDVSKSCKQSIEILDLATVGVLGMCLYASPLRVLDADVSIYLL